MLFDQNFFFKHLLFIQFIFFKCSQCDKHIQIRRELLVPKLKVFLKIFPNAF